MLKADYDVNSKNNMSQTPLCTAISNYSFQVAEKLLKHGKKLYCMSTEVQFDIVSLVMRGKSLSLMEQLLDYEWIDEALMLNTTSRTHRKATNYLIQATKLTQNGKNLLHIAVHGSMCSQLYFNVPQNREGLLGDKRPSINYERAALVPIVRVLLLKYKLDVNMADSEGKTPLYIAVESGTKEIVEELLNHNPDIHCESNRKAFRFAIKKLYDSHIINKFLQLGFTLDNADINDVELFHSAAEKGFLRIIKDFVKLGIDVNIQDKEGCSAIYWAILHSKANVVSYLLRHNSFVENYDGWFVEKYSNYSGPLFLIVNEGEDVCPHPYIKPETVEVIMEYFLQTGADINVTFHYFDSPLDFVIGHNNIYYWPDTAVAAAEVLLRHGAIVNHISTERFKGGDTYLHISIRKKNQEMAKLLLDYNADIDVENNKGHTPLYVAIESYNVNPAIVELLLDHGAHVVDHKYVHAKSRNYGIIKMHIEKLIQADLYVSPDLVLKCSPFNNNDDTDSYRSEVELMMTTPLGNYNTTTYHTLLKETSHHEILNVLRNERVWQTLETEEYRKVFPNYGYMIFGQFRRGRQRKKLVQILLENRHLVKPQLDNECLEEIVSYLTNPELRCLVHALVPIKILNEAYKKVEDYPDYKELEDNSEN